MSAPEATCELWIDGERVGDSPSNYLAGLATALAPLTVTWGRDNVLDQPEAATCGFTLQRRGFFGPESLRRIGSRVDVYAEAPGSADFESTEAIEDGQFTLDPQPADRVSTLLNYGSNTELYDWVDTGGSRGLVIQQDYWQAAGYGGYESANLEWRLLVPPRAWTPDPEDWDGVPHLRTGGPWIVTADISGPNRTDAGNYLTMYGLPRSTKPSYFTADLTLRSTGDGNVVGGYAPTTGFDQWGQIRTSVDIAPDEGQIWPLVGFWGPEWPASWRAVWVDRWELGEGSWADYRPGRSWAEDMCIRVDNVSVLAPEDAPARTLVFSGRITDAEMSYPADDVTVVNYTAADLSAELANVVVGDEPWQAERADARMRRIVGLLPASVRPVWKPGLSSWAAQRVGYRDVDAQPAFGLLADVAQSAGLVLWVATHHSSGPYLYPEDPGDRTPLRRFMAGDNDTALVVTNGAVGLISGCDILRDPLTWAESAADRTTRVDVTWQEQTTDEDGKPAPTERTVELIDTDAELLYGMRRLSVGTELTASADALTLANRLRDLTRDTGWSATGFSMPVGLLRDSVPGVDSQTRQRAVTRLLGGVTRLGLAVNIIFDPPPAPSAGYPALAAYVEGGTYEYDNGWTLNLNMTPATYQGTEAFMPWNGAPQAWAWQSMAAVTWVEAWAAPI